MCCGRGAAHSVSAEELAEAVYVNMARCRFGVDGDSARECDDVKQAVLCSSAARPTTSTSGRDLQHATRTRD